MTNRLRNAAAALLFLGCLVSFTSAFNLQNTSPALPSRLASLSTIAKPVHNHGALTIADRVGYQQAIEEVYWRHRIWPKERPDPKPSLDAVISQAQLEKKVEDYLRNSQELENQWQGSLTAGQLQAEMERMAQHTRQPEVLRELFQALGNDPVVIAECVARPALVERLRTKFYGRDQGVFGSNWARAEHPIRNAMLATSGNYTLPRISDGPSGCVDNTWTATSTINAPTGRYEHTAVWTGSEMIVWVENSQL